MADFEFKPGSDYISGGNYMPVFRNCTKEDICNPTGRMIGNNSLYFAADEEVDFVYDAPFNLTNQGFQIAFWFYKLYSYQDYPRVVCNIPVGSDGQTLKIYIFLDTLTVYDAKSLLSLNIITNLPHGSNYFEIKVIDIGEDAVNISWKLNNGNWSSPVPFAVKYTDPSISKITLGGIHSGGASATPLYIDNFSFSDKTDTDMWDYATLLDYSYLRNPVPPTPTNGIVFWRGLMEDSFSKLVRSDYYRGLDWAGKTPVFYGAHTGIPHFPERFVSSRGDYPITTTGCFNPPADAAVDLGRTSKTLKEGDDFRIGFWTRIFGADCYLHAGRKKAALGDPSLRFYPSGGRYYVTVGNQGLSGLSNIAYTSGVWFFAELRNIGSTGIMTLYFNGLKAGESTAKVSGYDPIEACNTISYTAPNIEFLNLMISDQANLDMYGGGTGLCKLIEYPKV